MSKCEREFNKFTKLNNIPIPTISRIGTFINQKTNINTFNLKMAG
jgi:hypothetical protein